MSEEGFPKLKNAGGFELLRCHPSSRTLILISCKWNADDLKKNVNPQANIYLRPIQKNLSIEPIVHDVISEEPVFSIRCMRCEKEFNARSLRLHLLDGCTGSQQQEEENCEVIVPVDDSDDLPSLDMLEEHTDRVHETDDLPSLQRPHRSEHVPEQSSPEISNSLIESDDQTTMGQRTEDLGRLPPELKEVVERIIKDCKENNIVDPVEILRKVQLELVTGRPLEVEDISQYIEGETNFITVDIKPTGNSNG